jgi:hypothetical protein
VSFQERAAAVPDVVERIDPELLDKLQTTPPGLPATPVSYLADLVVESEHGPQILAHFSEHPEVVRDLMAKVKAGAGPSYMARVIGRLEAQFEGSSASAEPAAPQPPAVSRAKPPVRPVAAGSVPTEDDPQDFDSWAAKENAREAKLRREGRL